MAVIVTWQRSMQDGVGASKEYLRHESWQEVDADRTLGVVSWADRHNEQKEGWEGPDRQKGRLELDLTKTEVMDREETLQGNRTSGGRENNEIEKAIENKQV